MKTVFTVSFFACMMLIASIAWSEIIYVNGTTGDDATGERGNPDKPFKTIQAGIDAAVDGDTVLVADDTYTGDGNKNLDFSHGLPEGETREITVKSENGPDNCIIDCENNGRGFYFHTGETSEAVVSGFTITNGYYNQFGGGIYCSHSSPAVLNTILWTNSPNEIYVDGTSELDITYSDILGGWEGDGNIDGTPSFVDPDNLGQSVASGIYFYNLQVERPDRDEVSIFTTTRKMVIVK